MPFIDDFILLQKKTPRISLVASNSENSDYTNYAYGNKNCYLVFGSHYNENVYYAGYAWKCKDTADSEEPIDCELCYEAVYCGNCYNCNYIDHCFGCTDVQFAVDCTNCHDCFLCVGLRNAEYCILNVQYTKEEYERKVASFAIKTAADIKKHLQALQALSLTVPKVFSFQRNTENCSGDDLRDCKNCYELYNGKFNEDVFYGYSQITSCKSSMDVTNIGYDPSELLYQCIGNTGAYNCNFTNACWHNNNLWYCDLVFNSHDCLGCVSLNHAEYRILNKQYTKETFAKKFEEIKAELAAAGMWGKQWLPSTYPTEDTMAAQANRP